MLTNTGNQIGTLATNVGPSLVSITNAANLAIGTSPAPPCETGH